MLPLMTAMRPLLTAMKIMFLAVSSAQDEAWVTVLSIILVILGILLACLFLIPLLRHLAFRIFLYFRCLFGKETFKKAGIFGFIIPRFWSDKPDYFLLSGKKLYAIKLKTYRKHKIRITFTSPGKWQIENLKGKPPEDSNHFLYRTFLRIHKMRVHKRLKKVPGIFKYASKINKALADEAVDCIPVVLFCPAIGEMMNNNMSMLSGDIIYHGTVVGNGLYPVKTSKSFVDSKNAKRIIKIAKKAIHTNLL